jgi:hypothetical protein
MHWKLKIMRGERKGKTHLNGTFKSTEEGGGGVEDDVVGSIGWGEWK